MPEECVEEEEEEEVAAARMESRSESAELQEVARSMTQATLMMCDSEEPLCRPPGKTESPSKRKGFNSEHFYIERFNNFFCINTCIVAVSCSIFFHSAQPECKISVHASFTYFILSSV